MQANLLQPLADPATLEMRLDAVEELLAETQLRADVQVLCIPTERHWTLPTNPECTHVMFPSWRAQGLVRSTGSLGATLVTQQSGKNSCWPLQMDVGCAEGRLLLHTADRMACMGSQASLQGMPKDLDRVRSGMAIKPSGADAARSVVCKWHAASRAQCPTGTAGTKESMTTLLSAFLHASYCFPRSFDVVHRRTSTLVSCFILLRDMLAALPALANALQPAQAFLLCTMRDTLSNGTFADMLATVNEVIDEVSRK